jgi:hypothetical protein
MIDLPAAVESMVSCLLSVYHLNEGLMMSFVNSLMNNAVIRMLVPSFAGLVFYGAWAYWINSDHGQLAALKAAGTQGSYSFVITLSLALTIEWLFQLMKPLRYRSWWVGSIACLSLYATSWGVNVLSDTPNILLTILPGAAVSTLYTAMYIMTLSKIKPTLANPV